MTAAEARARLQRHTQADQAPALTAAEVDDLLAMARVADAAGVAVDAVGYLETWTDAGLEAAAVMGWLWKAGKAKFDVKAGTTEAKRSQVAEMCRQMAAEYRGRIAVAGRGSGFGGIGSIGIVSSLAAT